MLLDGVKLKESTKTWNLIILYESYSREIEMHQNWKRTKAKCFRCGGPFGKCRPAHRFCSPKCQKAHWSGDSHKGETRICAGPRCLVLLTWVRREKHRFCSIRCRGEAYRLGRGQTPRWRHDQEVQEGIDQTEEKSQPGAKEELGTLGKIARNGLDTGSE